MIRHNRLECRCLFATSQFPLGLKPEPPIGVPKQLREPWRCQCRPIARQKRGHVVITRRLRLGGRKTPDAALALAVPALHPVAHPDGTVRAKLDISREHVLERLLLIEGLEARPLRPQPKAPHRTTGRAATKIGQEEASVEVGRQTAAGIGGKARRAGADVC